jgi:hypothetical protein
MLITLYESHIEGASLEWHTINLVRIYLLVDYLCLSVPLHVRRLHHCKLNALTLSHKECVSFLHFLCGFLIVCVFRNGQTRLI